MEEPKLTLIIRNVLLFMLLIIAILGSDILQQERNRNSIHHLFKRSEISQGHEHKSVDCGGYLKPECDQCILYRYLDRYLWYLWCNGDCTWNWKDYVCELITHHNIPTTTESAARLKPPKINCAWSDWNIGDCSVSCGLGTRSETRKKKIIEQNGGECIGESNLTTECHDQNCPDEDYVFEYELEDTYDDSNFTKGNGIYIIVDEGSVVEDEGNTIREEIAETVQDCEDLCSSSESCESFRYCKGDSEGMAAKSCILKDKKLTGNEPTIFVENCASYYTADCNEDSLKKCEAADTSNNCEKIKGNDTCLCGRDPECDINGQKPKCVNSYGHSEPLDTSLTCKAICEDKDPEYCERESKILGDRVCEQEWFTSKNGKYGCKKTCNCCYEKSCSCNDRDEHHCKSYVRHYGEAFCRFEWFISYFGKYGCKESCNMC